ncbi:hypothetical protein ACFPVX_02165 [Cohnella faecalis]|uniref:Uncharacterized protein n=1 Tax=Cohnella faecalis TaxID=2315694 RepID=A0A398CQI3_9BACL|nr:hypothetical protein [Cohnella faecalis]RIE04805.1 hypothetical protein D3H35_04875 [Cohnella faecalis]
MPYALKRSDTGQLLASRQVNGYGLPYYGIVLWEEAPTSLRITESLAFAGLTPDDPIGSLSGWETVELTEHQAKMANVKLRNDPLRTVKMLDGTVFS